MASNSFGNLFKITTFGESHGKAVGVVIDGCPAGLEISDEEINLELKKRAPGQNAFTSPRKELDEGEILSGVFEGKTTGAPICFLVKNKNADSSKYEPMKDLYRPGHANFTYLEKYGVFDYRGGGRSSARETVARVAAGAVAKKLLKLNHIEVLAFVKEIGSVSFEHKKTFSELKEEASQSPIFCPDQDASQKMQTLLKTIMEEGDSLGGVVEFMAINVPVGLGDPIYEKLEANLAKAMLSIPASKGFEIGEGLTVSLMKGSEHNDPFSHSDGKVHPSTNHSGGTLGGISTGQPICGRVHFKPTSSIKKNQSTVNMQGEFSEFKLPEGSRHDPCLTIRAAPVVEAMLALVLADAWLLHRTSRI